MIDYRLKLGKEDMRGLKDSERGKESMDLKLGSHDHTEPQHKQCLQEK